MLSILIPTYNYSVYPLVDTLQKMAVNDTIAFEIIVMDDCSPNTEYLTDNEFINTLSGCSFLRNEINLGRTATRTKLAQVAKFDYLLFLDADVMPVNDLFIKEYDKFIDSERVVLGGVAYRKGEYTPDTVLRYKYGINREEKSAADRNINPYSSVLSANILVPKKVFLNYNFNEDKNLYGMDNYFSYNLFVNKIPVLHIDNPVYHLGLENDEVFFRKCIESVKNRKQLLENAEGVENINSLLRHYKKIKKYRLTGVISLGFKLTEPILKKMILKKDPNLFCLDIYRLGYICTLK